MVSVVVSYIYPVLSESARGVRRESVVPMVLRSDLRGSIARTARVCPGFRTKSGVTCVSHAILNRFERIVEL